MLRGDSMAQSSVKQLNILILGDDEATRDLPQRFEPRTSITHVHTFAEAIHALRADTYDLVVTRVADFLPLRVLQNAEQAAAIVDSVNQGVCIVNADGEVVFANSRMAEFDDEVREQLVFTCREALDEARQVDLHDLGQFRGRRCHFTASTGDHFELNTTPILGQDQIVTQIAAVIRDTTNSRRLQAKIDAIDEAGRELVGLDVEQYAGLDPQGRLAMLEEKIFRCMREILHYDNFVIFVLDKDGTRLEPVFSHGVPVERCEQVSSATQGNGITGYVASRGRSYICPDTQKDPRYLPGLDGARSSLTVPIRLNDRVIGVADFESTRPAAFGEDDRQFASIFCRYIGLALHVLDLLVSEQRTTTGRLGNDVMSEIRAPLNDILTEVESLVEDYIGHDDIRHRLRKISENAVSIRDTINELTSPSRGVKGQRPCQQTKRDPVLEGKCFLVVDDEDLIRDTVQDVLCALGCQVFTANDGDKAIALIQEHKFDLVLSDIKMPTRNGYEVFAAAKERNADTPVILTTGFGYDPNHSIVRARREGLSSVLFKPFKVEQLLDELHMALQPAK